MFIRKTHLLNRETKKSYFNFQLVESIRTERGPRQRILLNLGSQLDLDKQECKLLADRIEEIVIGHSSLFPAPEKIEKLAQIYAQKLVRNLSVPMEKIAPTVAVPDLQTIDLKTLIQQEARTVGSEHLLLTIASELKLPEYFKKLGFSQTEIALSLSTIIARAVFPASERATFSRLQYQSGLGELLDFDFHDISLEKLYQTSDLLLKHKESLEKHLKKEQRSIHGVVSTLILYDLTNTYMEGQAKSNPKAKHGVSKEKRTDCPLVTLGLVVDQHGFILRSKFLEGNVSEPKSLDQAIQALGYESDLIKPTLVIDAGISSAENLSWLKNNGYTYIVSARQDPPTAEINGEHEYCGDDGQVKVAHLKIEDDKEDRWLICHSPAKEATASQMKTIFQQRFEHDLSKLHAGLSKPKGRKKYEKVLERVGRLKEKHRKISGCYEITVTPSTDQKTAIAVEWKILSEKLTEKLTGEYFLRTNLMDKGAKELWDVYNMLRRIEDSFRFMKSALGMRPVYHQKGKRVDGHLWITILAYYLIQDVMYRLKKRGIVEQWQTVRTHLDSRVRVTAQVQTDQNKTLHVRSTTEPEVFHKKIYEALGLSSKILSSKKSVL
jgi:transposase